MKTNSMLYVLSGIFKILFPSILAIPMVWITVICLPVGVVCLFVMAFILFPMIGLNNLYQRHLQSHNFLSQKVKIQFPATASLSRVDMQKSIIIKI
jgi:hypothetical protein